MNNNSTILYQKAALTVCLFLLSFAHTRAQEWQFTPTTQKAYDLIMDLRTADAYELIPQPKTIQEHYVIGFGHALELLISEDPKQYSDYEDHLEQIMSIKIKPNDPNELFLLAETHLQWAFVYLKFGHEFDAASNLRQAYLTSQEIKKKFPNYQAIHKTSGLLEIIVGSVPEKYGWVLGLLNMEGNIDTGIAELEQMRRADHPLALQAGLLYALVQGFVLQQTEAALTNIKQIQKENPGNRLILFLGASLAIKNSASEEALAMLTPLVEKSPSFPLYYADYLRGEVYLHKAEYLNAISAYRAFINTYKGQNYVKDAYYKIGLCYWLNGNKSDAIAIFKQATDAGKEVTEADKYAAHSLAQKEFPHIALTRARYYTDGGYYTEARSLLESLAPNDLPTKRDQVEYYYRKARLAHKSNDLPAAKLFYQQTIDLSGMEEWYFAPNACLQSGYISIQQNDNAAARTFFSRALGYKKHEYKNSIDSKAKSALAQLKDKDRSRR